MPSVPQSMAVCTRSTVILIEKRHNFLYDQAQYTITRFLVMSSQASRLVMQTESFLYTQWHKAFRKPDTGWKLPRIYQINSPGAKCMRLGQVLCKQREIYVRSELTTCFVTFGCIVRVDCHLSG